MEIWGWKEREKLEKLQERFLRWMMGLERRTPGYMVRKELQREKLRTRAGRRTWGFEERLREREEAAGEGLARMCLQEMREGKWERVIRMGNGKGEVRGKRCGVKEMGKEKR